MDLHFGGLVGYSAGKKPVSKMPPWQISWGITTTHTIGERNRELEETTLPDRLLFSWDTTIPDLEIENTGRSLLGSSIEPERMVLPPLLAEDRVSQQNGFPNPDESRLGFQLTVPPGGDSGTATLSLRDTGGGLYWARCTPSVRFAGAKAWGRGSNAGHGRANATAGESGVGSGKARCRSDSDRRRDRCMARPHIRAERWGAYREVNQR